MSDCPLRMTSRYVSRHADVRVGIATAIGISRDALARDLAFEQPGLLAAIRADTDAIDANVERYAAFYRTQGFTSPLTKQLQMTRRKGFPSIDPLVGAMLTTEMRTGVLMGAHDLDQIDRYIELDLAVSGEGYQGMREPIVCRESEIVARDYTSIIFSYFQGADARTCISPRTKNVMYFGFGAPGISDDAIESALSEVVRLLKPASTAASVGTECVGSHRTPSLESSQSN